MFDKLFDGMKTSENELTQKQKEATIDLMLLMMYADRNIAKEERDMLKEKSQEMTWENTEYYLELYIDKRIADVREAISDEKKTDVFIESIAARLTDFAVKEETLKLLVNFMESDFDIAEKEKGLLEKVEVAFGM